MKINIKQIREQPITKLALYNKIREAKYFEDNNKPTISERILLVCDWQDISAESVEEWHINTLNKVVVGIIQMVHNYTPEAPKTRIGKYTHRIDYLKFSVGHWKHIELIDFENEPEKLLALFYIEEGLHYGHEEVKGGRKTVINPLDDRAKAIKELVKLNDLVDLLAFFLNTSNLLRKPWVLNLMKMEVERRKILYSS